MLASPGLLFRTARRLTIASLVVIGVVALVQLCGRLAFDVCSLRYGMLSCARMDLGPTFSDLGVPAAFQEKFVTMPPAIPAILFSLDLLAAFLLVRPRRSSIDEASRTITLRTARWPRRARVTRLSFEEIAFVHVRRRVFLHVVEIVDRRHRSHQVTGAQLFAGRQQRVVDAIDAAIERAV